MPEKKQEEKPVTENKESKEEIKEAQGISSELFIYPLVSEKAVDKIEKENKITFIIKKDAGKKEIKEVFEEEFKAKVDKVNIIRDMKGRKKAAVTVNKQQKASEIAMKLGIL